MIKNIQTNTQVDIAQLNNDYREASPSQIIKKAIELNSKAIITTNFKPYAATILHAVKNVNSEMPVIWCDTGYNTPQTYKHAEEVTSMLNLNLHTYVPQQTTAFRNVVLGIPNIEDPKHVLFTEQVKLEPFKRALAEHQPQVWFTNLRKGQTAFRDSLDIFSLSKNGILKVSPFYYWSDLALDQYLKEHQLPIEHNYFDPTKALEHRECGLHN